VLFEETITLYKSVFLFTAGAAGAVDEEIFMASFEDVKRVSIFNGKALTDEIAKVSFCIYLLLLTISLRYLLHFCLTVDY